MFVSVRGVFLSRVICVRESLLNVELLPDLLSICLSNTPLPRVVVELLPLRAIFDELIDPLLLFKLPRMP